MNGKPFQVFRKKNCPEKIDISISKMSKAKKNQRNITAQIFSKKKVLLGYE